MPLQPGTTLGPYAVTAKIGEGGMGEVYRARDTKLDRDVALKVLPEAFTSDSDRLARFEREAKVLASLNHPNIGHIYGLEEAEGQKALVLELIEGPTLADRIAQGPIPIDEALEAAHEQGVIHRDLKPANVKVKADGTVKVLDFGLAKAFQPEGSDPNLSMSPTISLTAAATQMGMVIGTAAYMAPEQASGKGVDRRADVWAFGVVLYEMLTGTRPFVGDDVAKTLAHVIAIDPDWSALPKKVAPVLGTFLRGCLEKNPKQRVHDIADMRLAMEGQFETGDREAAESVAAVAPAPWRRVLPAIATAVVVGAIAVPAGWLLKPADPRPVVRSVHALPDGRILVSADLSSLMIASDGEHFIYHSNDGLYLRTLDALEDRPIPGTDGLAISPFLSPDGQSVGFFRSGRGGGRTELVRMAVTGGAPVKLADSDIPSGASWGTDGTILYGQPDGIWQVSENGGEPQHLIATDPTVERVYGPQRLPGGDWVMFTLAPEAGVALWDEADIVAESPASGARKVLRQGGGTDARYVPTGHLVYAYQSVLYAVPFDVSSLAVLGGPVPVVQGVRVGAATTVGSGAVFYAFTTGGTLVYVPGSGIGNAGNTLAWVDGSGGRELIELPPGQYAHPRFSPDGQWLAVERQDGMRTDVWLYDVSGAAALRRLTEGGTNRYPVWSRDGEYVVFQSDRDSDAGIFWQRADGTGSAERLTTPESDTVHIPEAWSPTEDRLAFSAMTGTSVELWMWALEDREGGRFGDTQSSVPFNTVFSPDGQWVAYTQRGEGAATYVQSLSVPAARYQIGRDEEIVHHPLWAPDGSRLFYFQGLAPWLPWMSRPSRRSRLAVRCLFPAVAGRSTSPPLSL